MVSILEQLKTYTKVVCDSGDVLSIAEHKPTDATTNPSLILDALKLYPEVLTEAIQHAKESANTAELARDMLLVLFGCRILAQIPGRVSTELDPALSFDTKMSIEQAMRLIGMYEVKGVKRERVLIKIAATWEGIKAAEQLERMGVHCNVTLVFSVMQARACAEANVTLISPFVGRIRDWHLQRGAEITSPDPGVVSVQQIHNYLKARAFATTIMGASFRNVDEIIELVGLDCLTISPKLLTELSLLNAEITPKLCVPESAPRDAPMTRSEFHDALKADIMASELLAAGITKFKADDLAVRKICAEKLE